MKGRKQEIRDIVLDIMWKVEDTKYKPDKFSHLTLGVAEVLNRRSSSAQSFGSIYPPDIKLEKSDTEILMEIFGISW